jgi:hypothetical protein
MEPNKDGAPPSGSDAITSESPSGQDEHSTQKDSVKYETYQKSVRQEKSLREKLSTVESQLAEFKTREQEVEEKRLAEQGEYKKLLELERKKRQEFESKVEENERNVLLAHKLNAFKESLPGKGLARPEYYDWVDHDSIVIDPDTGIVDQSSVEAAVNKFVQDHHRLLDTSKPGLPNQAPQGQAGKLTVEQWKALPVKERRARMGEVHKDFANN